MTDNFHLNKVVFIDDDPITNEFHKKLAESIQLAKSIEFYETGEEACKKYSNVNNSDEFPDLFFVDLGLPQMDGHELGLRLRKLDGFKDKNSKVCFLTASKDIRDVVKADNHQFEHYYWKPMDKRKMQQLLREVFNIVE